MEPVSFEELKQKFEIRYQNSLDREILLRREIQGIEGLFYEEKLDLLNLRIGNYYFIGSDSLDYFEVLIIRAFYLNTIVERSSFSESTPWLKELIECCPSGWLDKTDIGYYSKLTSAYFDYLQWLKQYPNSNIYICDTIIQREVSGAIYNHFSEYFTGETKEGWINRFYYHDESEPIDPIHVSKAAKEGSTRLILIGILSSINKTTGGKFNFQAFVQHNFGILNYHKTKSINKNKRTFEETEKRCDKIIKDATI